MSRYTYIVDINDLERVWNGFEKSKKYEIRKCNKDIEKSFNLEEFDILHKETRPDRKIDYMFIVRTWQKWFPNCRIYKTDTSMAFIGWNNESGYYLLAARRQGSKDGSPSKILWQVMQDMNKLGVKKFDLCGCNKPNTDLFKKGFGGKKVEQLEPCLKY